ncbi:MAG: RDD family protein [Bacilli bacterium]
MTFDRRLRAYSIDSSLAFTLMVVCMIAIYNVNQITPLGKFSIAMGCYFAAMIIPHLFSPGQTFGKRVQKLKIVKNYQELVPKTFIIPKLYLLILREIVKAALTFSTFGLYIFVAGIVSSGREDGRTIHDFIFKTRVIALTKYTSDRIGLSTTTSAANSLKGSTYDD